MRLFWTVSLCLLISETLPAQQPAWLTTAFAKDSARVARLNEEHKRLPQGLHKEVRLLDSVLNDICDKNKIEPRERCDKVQRDLKEMRNELSRIESEIGLANQKRDSVQLAWKYLESFAQTCPSSKAYKDYKNRFLDPQITGYKRLFTNIEQREKQLARQALHYGKKNFWSKEPFVTTIIRDYLKQIREEDARQDKEAEELKSEKEKLTGRKKELDAQVTGLKGEVQRLQSDSVSLRANKDTLDKDLVLSNKELDNKKKELDSRKKELEERTKELGKLRDSIAHIEQRLSLIKDSLDIQIRFNQQLKEKNEQLRKSLETRIDSLKIVTDNLIAARIDLKGTSTKLEEAFDRREAMGIAAVFILILLYLSYILYLKERNARKGKQKVRSANARLAAANAELKEKQAELKNLIGELHHRTKNNLQEISSLLYLQARDKDDDNLKNALNEARGRIDAIGIVHRLLYQDKQQRLTAVNIAQYIEELVEHLFKSHYLSRESVRTAFNLQEVYINADKATQLGLITNELVHNAFKHAFPKTEHPELAVCLEVEAGALYLTVKDNGPGLPPGTKLGEVNSFGLKLVRQLVEGRRGMLRYDEKNGAAFKVTLPLDADEFEVAT